MSCKNIENITNEFIQIIKNNTPEKSIKMLSNIRCNNELIGKKNALKIYINLSNYSVKYDIKKYKNNIEEYKNLVQKNIQKAKNSI